jgi:hypothetical protein
MAHKEGKRRLTYVTNGLNFETMLLQLAAAAAKFCVLWFGVEKKK